MDEFDMSCEGIMHQNIREVLLQGIEGNIFRDNAHFDRGSNTVNV